MNKIQYGIGKDYLSHWTVEHALREVFQNYMDYGEYSLVVTPTGEDKVTIVIKNDYKPENLEFMRIGNSYKPNEDSIGKYGEGLKMAFLIFLREGLSMYMYTNKYAMVAAWEPTIIGEALSIKCTENKGNDFTTVLTCPKSIFDEFIKGVLKDEDKVVNSFYGDVVDENVAKGKGAIYSGGMYVCSPKDLTGSYNIKPIFLPLNRDRLMPSDFDIDWCCSKINQTLSEAAAKEQAIIGPVNYNNRTFKYVDSVPEGVEDNYTLHTVANTKVLIDKVTKEPLNNSEVKAILLKRPKFQKQLEISNKLKYEAKKRISAKKTVLSLVRKFKKDYCKSVEEIQDINIIINKLQSK